MAPTVRYRDSKGRVQRLTPEQAVYLRTAETHPFERGWGGLRGTITVRLLRARGLITLVEQPGVPWIVTGITTLGRRVLSEWRRRHGD